MGERGVTHDEATADDIRAMCAIVGEGLKRRGTGLLDQPHADPQIPATQVPARHVLVA
jgi:hypothetical protein